MQTEADELEFPRSDRLSNALMRHGIPWATYSRMPTKPAVYYVGKTPYLTLESERAWLRVLHEQAAQQMEVNVASAKVAAASRRGKRKAA